MRAYFGNHKFAVPTNDLAGIFGGGPGSPIPNQHRLNLTKGLTHNQTISGVNFFISPKFNKTISLATTDFDFCTGIRPDDTLDDFRILCGICAIRGGADGGSCSEYGLRYTSSSYAFHDEFKYYELDFNAMTEWTANGSPYAFNDGDRMLVFYRCFSATSTSVAPGQIVQGDGNQDAADGYTIPNQSSDYVYDRLRNPWVDISNLLTSDFHEN